MKRDSKTYSKVPEVTLGFWIIKILATTLGETAAIRSPGHGLRQTSSSTRATLSEARSSFQF